MSNNSTSRSAIVAAFLLIILGYSAQHTFGQCGSFFSPDYRAIDKIRFQNNDYFHLDDWTGDGKSDYWNFRSNLNGTNDILIYPSKPAGYWDWDNPVVYSTTIPSGSSLSGVYPKVRDFDLDGKIDILYKSQVYRNTGTGSLAAQAPITITDAGIMSNMSHLGYYDVTGDGRLDWVYIFFRSDSSDREIRFQPGTSDGAFGNASILGASDPQHNISTQNISVGDFDGDGKLDFVFANPTGQSASWVVFRNMGNGTFQAGQAMPLDARESSFATDANGDGRMDIVTSFGGTLVILYGQANGTLSRTAYPGVPSFLSGYVVDVNGDHLVDFFTFESFVAGSFATYSTIVNDGSGGYTKSTYSIPAGYQVGINTKVEDVTGDGKADLLASASIAGSPMPANTFGEHIVVVFRGVCQKARDKVNSFASDNEPDIVTWDSSNGQWSWKNWIPNTPSTLKWGTVGDVPSPGDFDGDGRLDHTVYRPGSGTWYSLLSSDASWSVTQFGLPGDKPVPNDYDGDGKTDVAVFRPADGNWHFLFSKTGSYGVFQFGLDGDKPVPADYDGDQMTDIAVYRPSNGLWYFVRSSDQTIGIVQYGISTDIPAPGDYDGDAKADLAVFRSGVWYILRSTTGVSNVMFWGKAGDRPIPMSKSGYSSDLTIYRSSDRTYWSRIYNIYVQIGSGLTPVVVGLPNN